MGWVNKNAGKNFYGGGKIKKYRKGALVEAVQDVIKNPGGFTKEERSSLLRDRFGKQVSEI